LLRFARNDHQKAVIARSGATKQSCLCAIVDNARAARAAAKAQAAAALRP